MQSTTDWTQLVAATGSRRRHHRLREADWERRDAAWRAACPAKVSMSWERPMEDDASDAGAGDDDEDAGSSLDDPLAAAGAAAATEAAVVLSDLTAAIRSSVCFAARVVPLDDAAATAVCVKLRRARREELAVKDTRPAPPRARAARRATVEATAAAEAAEPERTP